MINQMTMTSFHFSERSKKAMNDIIVLYEYYTIIPDNNLGYIFEVNECKYVKSNGDDVYNICQRSFQGDV